MEHIMKTNRITLLVCALAFLSCDAVFAQSKSKKKEKTAEKSAPATQEPSETGKPGIKVSFAITASEREAIRGYCVQFEQPGKKGKKARSLPPGLAKKVSRGGRLPPGWEKKLVVGEIVPEPVFKECHPLPPEIVVKLPVPPPETILRAIHGKIVRLHGKTREILDVFDPFN